MAVHSVCCVCLVPGSSCGNFKEGTVTAVNTRFIDSQRVISLRTTRGSTIPCKAYKEHTSELMIVNIGSPVIPQVHCPFLPYQLVYHS